MLGICFGAFGLLAGAQDIAMPYLFTIQKQAIATISRSFEEPAEPQSAPTPAEPESEWSAAMHALVSSPPWYPRYAMGMGIVRTLLGVACMLVSLALISVRPGADFLFMLTLGLSAARNLTAAGMGLAAGTLFSFWAMASGLIGFMLDVILLLVCAACDRKMYEPRGE
ncbi:MAG: hypothetical protein A3H91_09185 [Gammaproteobacteria bacterium RIFCSPLOWO2_02_FULL_61_13]|nr:MAG: hypothetical protein A3H91_09185 [Gammaproteobacteria bacterium RIFCSPLOWO2_02_FULL_61_13]